MPTNYKAWRGVVNYFLKHMVDNDAVDTGKLDAIFKEITPALNVAGIDSIFHKSFPRETLPSRELILSEDAELNTHQSLPTFVILIDIDRIGTKKPFSLK